MAHGARWWDIRPAESKQPKTYTCSLCNRRLFSMNPNTLQFPRVIASDVGVPTPRSAA
jgi:hypothetical protein